MPRISALSSAATLTGTETAPVVQSGATVKATTAQIATLANSSTRSVATGGTGGTNQATAQAGLGLVIGTNVQAFSANLTTHAGQTRDTDVTLAAASDTRYATQLAVKTYADTRTVGRHSIAVGVASINPSASGGCAAEAVVASGANLPDIRTLDFDTTTQEYAQFSLAMPRKWNEGTITFKPIWSHAATVTNFGVVWSLQAVAVSDDDTIAAAFGTVQTSTDTGGTTDDLYIGPESSAITIAGTPAPEDVVFFRISRVTADAGDTMAIDARLHGVVIYITTASQTDA